jgi:hypothetical protein
MSFLDFIDVAKYDSAEARQSDLTMFYVVVIMILRRRFEDIVVAFEDDLPCTKSILERMKPVFSDSNRNKDTFVTRARRAFKGLIFTDGTFEVVFWLSSNGSFLGIKPDQVEAFLEKYKDVISRSE